jgi:serralysin
MQYIITYEEIPVARYDPVSNTYSLEETDIGPFIVPGATAMAGVIGDVRGNVIHGNGSANILEGMGGDDTLYGEDGDDKLYGGDGNDSLFGGNGSETLEGGAGDDTYSLHFDETIIEFDGGGVDTIIVNTNYILPNHVDNMRALDTDVGFKLTGNNLNNIIIGSEGMDRLNGGAGADTLEGGAGTDFYYVDDARDVVIEQDPGPGDWGSGDRVYTSVSYTLGANVEVLQTTESEANLVLTGNALDNLILGNFGANILDGGSGKDWMMGGAGNDTYIIDHQNDWVDDAAGIDTVLTSISYSLAKVECEIEMLTATGSAGVSLTGSASANAITANAANNRLDGGAGNDTLKGGAGNDKVYGGLGKDVLYGGAGRDIFAFDTRPNKTSNLDRVMDFRVVDDTIWLDNKYMPKLGRAGKLNKEFFSLNGRHEKDDYLSYSSKTGVLSYDADGSGVRAAAVAIAILKKGLGLTASDFVIV